MRNLLGESNPMYGRTGSLNPFFGKHHTVESLEKIKNSDYHKNMKLHHPFKGKKHSELSKERMSKTRKDRKIPERFWGNKEWKERQIELIKEATRKPEVREQARKMMLERFKEHPELHPNYIIGNKKTMRKSTELPMYSVLQELGFRINEDYFFQFRIKEFNVWVDFAFPNLKLVVECDGKNWHNAEKDARRDKALRFLGWNVLRFNEVELKNRSLIIDKLNNELGGVTNGMG